LVETHGPVDSAERGAKHVNINLLRYFSEPATLDSKAKTFLQCGMALAMEWATQGLVVPHVSQTIDSTVEAINAGLQSLKAVRGTLGKVGGGDRGSQPGRREVTGDCLCALPERLRWIGRKLKGESVADLRLQCC
jgi:hypothetical protein